MRVFVINLLIICLGGWSEKIEAESLYTLEFSRAKGDVIEWFESKGWEEQLDMDSMNLHFEKDKLIIEPWKALSGALNIIFKDDKKLKGVNQIRIDWGVDQYPEGADWSGPIKNERNVREPIAVIVYFGVKTHDSGSVFVPNLPYFLGFFLGKKELQNVAYYGNYWQRGGRYFCIPCNGKTGDFITEADLNSLFKKQFRMNPPPISGIAIETDVSNTPAREGRHSKAYLRKIELLP